MPPYFSYKSTVEKLFKSQENSSWMVISLILVTTGGLIGIDIKRRNLMLIAVRTQRVNEAGSKFRHVTSIQ